MVFAIAGWNIMLKKTLTTLRVILTSRDTLKVDNKGAIEDNKDNDLW